MTIGRFENKIKIINQNKNHKMHIIMTVLLLIIELIFTYGGDGCNYVQ